MTNELVDFTLVSIALLAIGIYGLAVKRNFIRMLFAVEIIINAANLNLVAFGRFLPHAGGQTMALFSIAIAAAAPRANAPHRASLSCDIAFFGRKIVRINNGVSK